MQQLYQLGCDWTYNCHMLLQGTNVIINSMVVVMHVTHLKTIINVQIVLPVLL